MATVASHNKPVSFPASALLAPFRAIGRFMIMLAEASPQARALNQLSQLSDDDLTAKGKTRSAEIHRILGAAAAI